jgi:hypothetical protein
MEQLDSRELLRDTSMMYKLHESAMSNPADLMGRPSSAFNGLSGSQWGTQFTYLEKSIPDGKRFFQASKRQIPSFSANSHPSVQNRSTLQLIYHL